MDLTEQFPEVPSPRLLLVETAASALEASMLSDGPVLEVRQKVKEARKKLNEALQIVLGEDWMDRSVPLDGLFERTAQFLETPQPKCRPFSKASGRLAQSDGGALVFMKHNG